MAIDPYKIPSLSPSIIGFDTQGNPVFSTATPQSAIDRPQITYPTIPSKSVARRMAQGWTTSYSPGGAQWYAEREMQRINREIAERNARQQALQELRRKQQEQERIKKQAEAQQKQLAQQKQIELAQQKITQDKRTIYTGSIYEKYAPDWVKKSQSFVETKVLTGKPKGYKEKPIDKITYPGSLAKPIFQLTGTKFYESGERKQLIEAGLSNLTSAQTYEEQQTAIQELKDRGIKITETTKNNQTIYNIDSKTASKTFAPVSVLGGALLGFSDAMLKTALFSPYMSSGAVKKTTAKAITKKVSEKTAKKAEKVIRKAEQLFKKGELEREVYRLQVKATTQTQKDNLRALLKELESRQLIKGYAYDTATGRFVLLDSSGNKIIPAKITGKPQLSIDVNVETFGVGQIERIPETLSSTSLFQGLKESSQTTRFSGLQPKGKFSPLNVLGTKINLNTISETRIKQKAKTKSKIKQEQISPSLYKSMNKLKTDMAVKSSLVSASATLQKQKYKEKGIYKLMQGFAYPRVRAKPVKSAKGLFLGLPRFKPIKSGKTSGLYKTSIRRFGKWKPVYKGMSLKQAFSVGKTTTGRTLGASFKISGIERNAIFGTPKGYYKSKREPGVFVEKRKYRLSTPSELKEIFGYKKAKGRRGAKKFKILS